ncbi:diacylglycerol kinase [Abditibacteriota bacterium]|nr:diacylglycerol kinase [Abditibacteriota bacterium]
MSHRASQNIMQQAEIALILNPGSGSNDEEFSRKVRAALEESGRLFICLETDPEKGAAPAVEKAAASGVNTIVVCGGDGTVMSAVNALGKADADIKLAIVPGGTANLLAHALSIPLDVERAMAAALEGDERRIDLGACGHTLFALGLGLGLTEKLVSGASAEEKERLGKWAYVKAMLQEVGTRPSAFTYTVDEGDEQTANGVAVVVANAGTLSGKIEFAPDAKMDDGKLDLVILHRLNARDLVRLAWKSVFGEMKNDRAITCVAGKTIQIKSNPPLDLQIDGETVELHPPLRVEVRPDALRVAVPSEEQKFSSAQAVTKALTQEIVKPMTKKVTRLRWWVWVLFGALISALVWKSRRK